MVLIPLWTQTPSQFGLVSSILFMNSFRQLTRVTFTLWSYLISPDWLTRISSQQLTQTPPERLTRSHQCLPRHICSYPAELPYPILLLIGLLLTWPYMVLRGRTTIPNSSPDRTSTYPIVPGHLTQLPYPAR
jgi:hypothetical protein